MPMPGHSTAHEYCAFNQQLGSMSNGNSLKKWKSLRKLVSYSPSRWYTLFQHIQSTITYTCHDAATFKCSLPNDIELIASSEFQNYLTWGAPTSNFDGLSPSWLPWLLRFQCNILDWGTQHKPITTWWVCSIHPKIINTLSLENLYPDEKTCRWNKDYYCTQENYRWNKGPLAVLYTHIVSFRAAVGKVGPVILVGQEEFHS